MSNYIKSQSHNRISIWDLVLHLDPCVLGLCQRLEHHTLSSGLVRVWVHAESGALNGLALGRCWATAPLAPAENLVLILLGWDTHQCAVSWLTRSRGLQNALRLGASVGQGRCRRACFGCGARRGTESTLNALNLNRLLVRCTWWSLIVLFSGGWGWGWSWGRCWRSSAIPYLVELLGTGCGEAQLVSIVGAPFTRVLAASFRRVLLRALSVWFICNHWLFSFIRHAKALGMFRIRSLFPSAHQGLIITAILPTFVRQIVACALLAALTGAADTVVQSMERRFD